MVSILAIYLGIGVVAGILAGLLGIGGGMVIVPLLIASFTFQKLPYEFMMHLALGTSLASIIFTSVSSFWAHHKRKAVHWGIVRRIIAGILLGTFLGTGIAARLSTDFLKGFFVVFLYYVAVQLLLNKRPEPSRQLPGSWGMFGMGGLIGVISSLVGIGGGALSVPYMIWCNIPVHMAIGTSAAIGFPIAIAGTLGYIINGFNATGLPPHTLGYIYLPALFGLVCASIFTAPLGVKLAHSLPVDLLKRIFAILLLITATRMLYGLFF
ncbi:MAG: sulfite exporter TauE/SafE family protein [Desulfobacteraceae bacterium]|jgi:uncharacterized membrane protein YfcA